MRFAIYFAPEEGTALGRFGWDWLGRDPGTSDYLPLPEEQAALVAQPRLYGFHATLKPPFRLAPGAGRDKLVAALASFAASRRAFVEPPLAIESLQGFLALRTTRQSAAVQDLADQCVRAFDDFRAPPSEAERRKRLVQPLSERHQELLADWGYPYLFEEWRFHMTLTGRLPDDEREVQRARLLEVAAPALAEPVEFRSVCLFEQQDERAFTLAARFPFGG